MEERTMEEVEIMEQKECTEAENKQEEVGVQGFWQDDRGVGVIEVILILVVLIGLVLIFKDQITSIITKAMSSISGDASQILK